MDIKNAKYELTAVRPDQYPILQLPEVALVGRSNVGKSSIINSLLNRKNLARVAAEPGKTRQINFYNVDNALFFADLPGYGYARVSKTEKASWGEMIETYLNSRKQLQLIIMLVDIRHAPSGDDQTMFDWLVTKDRPRLVVATKLDKITRGQVQKQLKDIRLKLAMDSDEMLIPFSAVTGQGRDEIWNQIRHNTTLK
jgi:GTP-binding protein